jgi:hypothetical protein
MKVATKQDRERAVDILTRAYVDVPGVLAIVKETGDVRKRVKALCEYCFDTMQPIGGVYITTCNNGVAMVYQTKDKKFRWGGLIDQIVLIFKAVGISRALKIMKRDKIIQQKRPKENILYFWMLAVDPEVRGIQAMKEIRDEIYELSEKLNMPIYAETTVDRNKVMYERYGFETYDTWYDNEKDTNVYFMYRPIKQGVDKEN